MQGLRLALKSNNKQKADTLSLRLGMSEGRIHNKKYVL